MSNLTNKLHININPDVASPASISPGLAADVAMTNREMLRGPPGPTPIISMTVELLPFGSLPIVEKTGDDSAPNFTIKIPASGKETIEIPITTVSTIWTVNHNLGCHPSITVVDSSGDIVEVDCRYLSPNSLVVSFNDPMTGTIYLN